MGSDKGCPASSTFVHEYYLVPDHYRIFCHYLVILYSHLVVIVEVTLRHLLKNDRHKREESLTLHLGASDLQIRCSEITGRTLGSSLQAGLAKTTRFKSSTRKDPSGLLDPNPTIIQK